MSLLSRFFRPKTMTPQKLDRFLRDVSVQQGNAARVGAQAVPLHFVNIKGGVRVASLEKGSVTTREHRRACRRLEDGLDAHRRWFENQDLDVDAAMRGLRALKDGGKRFGPAALKAFTGWRNDLAHERMHAEALNVRDTATAWKAHLQVMRHTRPADGAAPVFSPEIRQAAKQAEQSAYNEAVLRADDFREQCLRNETKSQADDEDRVNVANWLTAALPNHPVLERLRAHTLHPHLLVDVPNAIEGQLKKVGDLVAEQDARAADPHYWSTLRSEATVLTMWIENYLDQLITAAELLINRFRVNELPTPFQFLLVNDGKALSALFEAHLNPSSDMMEVYRYARDLQVLVGERLDALSHPSEPAPAVKTPLAMEGVDPFPARVQGATLSTASAAQDDRPDVRTRAIGRHRDATQSIPETRPAETAAFAACDAFFGKHAIPWTPDQYRLMTRLQEAMRLHPGYAGFDVRSLAGRVRAMPQDFAERYRVLERLVGQCHQGQGGAALEEDIRQQSQRLQRHALEHIAMLERVAQCLDELADDEMAQEFQKDMRGLSQLLADLASAYGHPKGPVMELCRRAHAFLVPARGSLDDEQVNQDAAARQQAASPGVPGPDVGATVGSPPVVLPTGALRQRQPTKTLSGGPFPPVLNAAGLKEQARQWVAASRKASSVAQSVHGFATALLNPADADAPLADPSEDQLQTAQKLHWRAQERARQAVAAFESRVRQWAKTLPEASSAPAAVRSRWTKEWAQFAKQAGLPSENPFGLLLSVIPGELERVCADMDRLQQELDALDSPMSEAECQAVMQKSQYVAKLSAYCLAGLARMGRLLAVELPQDDWPASLRNDCIQCGQDLLAVAQTLSRPEHPLMLMVDVAREAWRVAAARLSDLQPSTATPPSSVPPRSPLRSPKPSLGAERHVDTPRPPTKRPLSKRRGSQGLLRVELHDKGQAMGTNQG